MELCFKYFHTEASLQYMILVRSLHVINIDLIATPWLCLFQSCRTDLEFNLMTVDNFSKERVYLFRDLVLLLGVSQTDSRDNKLVRKE